MTPWRFSPARPRPALVLALLVTLLGLSLRLYRLSNQSLWIDEIYSIVTARVPLDKIAAASAETNNSLPTFFLMLRAVIGHSNQDIEAKARLLSVLAGTLSIPLFMGVIYLWGRRAQAALIGGLLLATNPLHLWYSQETRAYATMLFFGLLSLLAFELARAGRSAWWWVLYFVSALAAIALHKTAVIFPGVCGLWHFREVMRRRSPVALLLIHLSIFIVAALALTTKSYPPALEHGRPASFLEIPYTFLTYVGGYSFGPSLLDIQSYGAWGAVVRNEPQLAVAAALLLVCLLACVLNLRHPISGKGATILVLSLGLVAGYAAISSFPYNIRYTLPALPGFLAILAAAVTTRKNRCLARLVLGATLAASLWADAQWFYNPAYRKEDLRATARWMIANSAHIRSWTIVPTYSSGPLEWYLRTLGHGEIQDLFQATRPNSIASVPPFPDVLIMGRRDHIVPVEQILSTRQIALGHLRETASFAGLKVFTRKAAD